MRAPLPQKTGNGFARSGGRLLQRICGVTRPVLLCSPPMLVVSIRRAYGTRVSAASGAGLLQADKPSTPLLLSRIGLSTMYRAPWTGVWFRCPHTPAAVLEGHRWRVVLLSRRPRSDLHRDLITCDTVTLKWRASRQSWTRALVSPSRGSPYRMQKRGCTEVTDVSWASLTPWWASLQRGTPCQPLTWP